ncbi:hypothetical protein F511_45310 [Dorcoceras hygrometricum]|uniref:Uncharacterized protein n=1 Tax=Dorcoceras hygrometricum TaxID=472368 RepID=A0A2Z6ZWE5_9LAMI|nr:hypothetical protein F511_45310 [Dorcoceras hygrometricum]
MSSAWWPIMYRRPSCHVVPRRVWRTAAAPRALSRASADARKEIGRAGRAMRPPLAQALRCWSGTARRGEGFSGDILVGDDGARDAPLLAGRCALSAASCARPCVALGATSRAAAVRFFVWRRRQPAAASVKLRRCRDG